MTTRETLAAVGGALTMASVILGGVALTTDPPREIVKVEPTMRTFAAVDGCINAAGRAWTAGNLPNACVTTAKTICMRSGRIYQRSDAC